MLQLDKIFNFYIFFVQTKAYIISLTNKVRIQNGNDSKVHRRDREMTALARV
jgi:hypothetical protein